jgi:arabinogalactan endo-1,4-beta-galactosidase
MKSFVVEVKDNKYPHVVAGSAVPRLNVISVPDMNASLSVSALSCSYGSGTAYWGGEWLTSNNTHGWVVSAAMYSVTWTQVVPDVAAVVQGAAEAILALRPRTAMVSATVFIGVRLLPSYEP